MFNNYCTFKHVFGFLLITFFLHGCVDQLPSKLKNTEQSVSFKSIEKNTPTIGSRAISNSEIFSQTLYPLLKNQCATCHGTSQLNAPFFAHDNVHLAYSESLSSVDLVLPENSRIVQRLRMESHYCWSSCNLNADELQAAITEWNSLIVANPAFKLYQQQCASCHGKEGQGVGSIVNLKRPILPSDLERYIESNMPPSNPTLCSGLCATQLSHYIIENFSQGNRLNTFSDPLAGFPQGQQQIDSLCSRLVIEGQDHLIKDVFCATPRPNITSLEELQTALGLKFLDPVLTGGLINGGGGNPAFTLTGHSSSLVARSVSAINPRAIIFTSAEQRGIIQGFVVMGFVRGDQLVELIASDRTTGQLSFFLFSFRQECNTFDNCDFADLLTPAVEKNWIDYTLFGQDDLSNTVLDCLQCHQPDGPSTTSILRMQELRNPWTHFFRAGSQGGQALIDDFEAAHGLNEDYAGIPADFIALSEPFFLESLIAPGARGGGGMGGPIPPTQPNEFNSSFIEFEVNQTAGQPQINDIPGVSPTWQLIYDASVRGEFISVPYHDVKVTDSKKLAQFTQDYQSYAIGTLAKKDFPDIRDIFLENMLPDMGFKVKPGLDGAGIIRQACTQCHNSKLDQTISRARFNVDLNNMSDTVGGTLVGSDRDAEIGKAIVRLNLSHEDIKLMPPKLFRDLDVDEIERATLYLCSQVQSTIFQCP